MITLDHIRRLVTETVSHDIACENPGTQCVMYCPRAALLVSLEVLERQLRADVADQISSDAGAAYINIKKMLESPAVIRL